jgi:hypothetical protein
MLFVCVFGVGYIHRTPAAGNNDSNQSEQSISHTDKCEQSTYISANIFIFHKGNT